MTPNQFLRLAVYPAVTQLEPRMNTPEAMALMLAIAMQESELRHRRQIKGPARSFYQMEIVGVKGVQRHHASRAGAARLLDIFCYNHDPETSYAAIEHNDVYASGLARYILWRLPQPLPKEGEAAVGWAQYMEAWRPGRPRHEKWQANFERAWECVNDFLLEQAA